MKPGMHPPASQAAPPLPSCRQATLQDTIDKLAAALGEANYYGSIFTIRHAAATQRAAGTPPSPRHPAPASAA